MSIVKVKDLSAVFEMGRFYGRVNAGVLAYPSGYGMIDENRDEGQRCPDTPLQEVVQ